MLIGVATRYAVSSYVYINKATYRLKTLAHIMDFHSPDDYTAYHTRKQKEEIRLKKKIDTYNKKLKKKPSKTLADALPISKPSEVSNTLWNTYKLRDGSITPRITRSTTVTLRCMVK